MKDSDHKTNRFSRVIAFGIFLIVLGLAVGIFTFVTIVGPIIGVLLIVIGAVILWKSAHDEPPGMV